MGPMSTTEIIIPELTDAHRASFPGWIERWTGIGRSCEPADRVAAEAAVADAYRAADLVPPSRVVWVPSPLGGAITQGILSAGVWDGVWAGVGDGVGAGVSAGVWDGVRDGGWSRNVLWNSHNVGWIAFYDWFAAHGFADVVSPLAGLTRLAQTAGWCWPFEQCAVVTDRPELICDERVPGTTYRRRLHNDKGPSVVYRDGWQLYHWHGLLVPEWVIVGPTIEAVMAEQNAEVRRAGIESYGWDRFVADAQLDLIDEQPDPCNDPHTIKLYALPDRLQDPNDPIKVVVVTNASPERDGTRRRYGLPVDVEYTDAVAAVASTFNRSKAEYLLLESAS